MTSFLNVKHFTWDTSGTNKLMPNRTWGSKETDIIWTKEITAMEIKQEDFKKKKNTWNLQCKKWFNSWDMVKERCLIHRKELKNHIQECYRKVSWKETPTGSNNVTQTTSTRREKLEFRITWNLTPIGSNNITQTTSTQREKLEFRITCNLTCYGEKQVLARIRTGLHRFRFEIGR